MAKPNNPNPEPGYSRVRHCPECGAFVKPKFGRVGVVRIQCEQCGYDETHETDHV